MSASAQLPPSDLDGLDPAWSRLVTAPSGDGSERTWHLLDNGAKDAAVTVLCVHGNPSWSYLYRDLVRSGGAEVRVIAVDQLDMGFSERTGVTRRLGMRVDDLCALTTTLGIDGRVITVAHDWGGPVSLGWALRNREQLDGIVLMNTAVHQPAGSPAPSVIRLVRSRPMLANVTTRTTAFIRGALEMGEHRPSSAVARGFLAPYATADRRAAIGTFVADIPLEPEHPSAATLDSIADGLRDVADVPALLVWGANDKVFSDLYLHDLERRLPHADVHRYPKAGHFVSEDTNAFAVIRDWIGQLGEAPPPEPDSESAATLDRVRVDDGARVAIAEMNGRSVDFGAFAELVDRTAAGLDDLGIRSGDRVALMIPPGIDLAATLLATWRIGGVAVLVDAGLGPRGMSAAVKSAAPDYLVGVPKALAAARALRWPGVRVSSARMSSRAKRATGAVADLPSLRGRTNESPSVDVAATSDAALAFTSGATGPSKGVRYTHAQLAAQRDAVAELYDITADDRLVAAFAPFALFGPLLGITSVVPDMDVTAPATLTASSLGDAVVRVDATMVFASPAALVNVVATAAELGESERAAFENVRLVLSAGAPVREPLLRSVAELFPHARICTPYGMTECLPVANIDLDGITAADGGDGVCVGEPIVDVCIRPLDEDAPSQRSTTTDAGVIGEILVRAPHARAGYDRLWHTEFLASQPAGWHATGDVGHLDDQGRLWVGGRMIHVITTAAGAVTPVAVEQAIETLDGVQLAAAVGIGPPGTQQVVAVLQTGVSPRLASPALLDRVRSVTDVAVAAVLEVQQLPVDRRHNSKINRARLAAWAASALAGGRIGSL